MIEISHNTARRLLNRSLHAQLGNSEWTQLQAHLEYCADCREYNQRLHQVENGLRRAMRSGWGPVLGPVENTPARVAATRQRRQKLRLRAGIAAAGIAGLALFFLLGGPAWMSGLGSRPLVAEDPAGEPVPDTGAESTPTPPGALADMQGFQGVVAYSAPSADGSPDVYLLNAGAGPVNLTDNPAADSDPSWSPDGEWIAFLSDRSTGPGRPGKVEVYVTTVTGSRVVQLTSEPGITWQGPISWDRGGRWLALTGVRTGLDSSSWVYLVALDGSGARALSGTRGAWSPKFSRSGDRLAFAWSDGERSGVQVYHLETQARVSADWLELSEEYPPFPGAALDWSPDGAGLAFISGGGGSNSAAADGSQVIAVSELNYSLSLFNDTRHDKSVADGPAGAFRAVSWTPGGAVAYLERTDGAPLAASVPTGLQQPCWQVRARIPGSNRDGRMRAFTGGELCVDGGFDLGSWTADGRWLVLQGRAQGDTQPAIYALRAPGRRGAEDGSSGEASPGALVRLADGAGAVSMPRVRPSLRSYDPPLSIDPRPVTERAALPPSDLTPRPGGPRGDVVYVSKQADKSVVVDVDPVGRGGRVLHVTDDRVACPRLSPDGQSLAFINTTRQSGQGQPLAPVSQGRYGREEIVLLDLASSRADRLRPLTWPNMMPGSGPEPAAVRYGCPVWSPAEAPGGPYIAALVSTGAENFLAVLPTRGGQARFVRTGSPVTGSGPLWSSDGRTIFLAQHNRLPNGPRAIAVSLPDDPSMPLTTRTMPPSVEWDNIDGILPEQRGGRLYLLTHQDEGSARALVRLSTAEPGVIPDGRDLGQVIGESYRRGLRSASMVGWMYDGSILMALRRPPTDPYKALLMRFDLKNSTLATIARIEDTLYSTELSPDGRWMLFSTEGGLWGLDLMGAAAGIAGPAFISPVPIEGLDWR